MIDDRKFIEKCKFIRGRFWMFFEVYVFEIYFEGFGRCGRWYILGLGNYLYRVVGVNL